MGSKQNITRLVEEAMVCYAERLALHAAIESATQNVFPRGAIEERLEMTFGKGGQLPDADVGASVLRMVDQAYRGRVSAAIPATGTGSVA